MKKWKYVVNEIFKEKILNHRRRYYTYTYVHMALGGEKYLAKRTVADLEKIVFLSQCYSLENNKHSMFAFNTYIFEGRVYFKYLSDLLRITPLGGFHGEPFAEDFNRIINNNYDKIIEKYSKLPEDELEKQFKEKIKEVENDKINFIHRKCNFTVARLFARNSAWWYNNNSIIFQLLRMALFYLCAGFVPAWIVYIIALCLTPFGIYMGILTLDVAQLIVISMLIFPTWGIWTYRICQPTKYEMEQGYDNDFDYKWFSNKKIKGL